MYLGNTFSSTLALLWPTSSDILYKMHEVFYVSLSSRTAGKQKVPLRRWPILSPLMSKGAPDNFQLRL
jgi:hypothetical protein